MRGKAVLNFLVMHTSATHSDPKKCLEEEISGAGGLARKMALGKRLAYFNFSNET